MAGLFVDSKEDYRNYLAENLKVQVAVKNDVEVRAIYYNNLCAGIRFTKPENRSETLADYLTELDIDFIMNDTQHLKLLTVYVLLNYLKSLENVSIETMAMLTRTTCTVDIQRNPVLHVNYPVGINITHGEYDRLIRVGRLAGLLANLSIDDLKQLASEHTVFEPLDSITLKLNNELYEVFICDISRLTLIGSLHDYIFFKSGELITDEKLISKLKAKVKMIV